MTNNTWSDPTLSWYVFQDDSGSIDEESSSHEHASRVDQGITINGNNVLAGNSTITINPGATACTLGSSCSIPLSAVNPQTSPYQVTTTDFSNYKTITVGGGGSFTITLVASTSQPPNGQHIHIINYGSGTISIARSGQDINGGTSSLILAAGSATAPTSADIISDGTNYFAYLAH